MYHLQQEGIQSHLAQFKTFDGEIQNDDSKRRMMKFGAIQNDNIEQCTKASQQKIQKLPYSSCNEDLREMDKFLW